MSVPLFSVIITTHHRPSLLKRAIKSVLDQAHDSLELIVVSDEGSLETAAAAHSLMRDRDVFIKRSGPPGPARSRNLGKSLARGAYVMFLDDDDAFLPGLFEHVARVASPAKDVIYFWDYEMVLEDRTQLDHIVKINSSVHSLQDTDPRALFVKNKLPNHVLAIPSRAVADFAFDERLKSLEDWDFLLALLSSGFSLSALQFIGSHYCNDLSAAHRNPTSTETLLPDYLSIYRRWPALDDEIRQLRHTLLIQVGFDVPVTWL